MTEYSKLNVQRLYSVLPYVNRDKGIFGSDRCVYSGNDTINNKNVISLIFTGVIINLV